MKVRKKAPFSYLPVNSIFRRFEPVVASTLNMTYYGDGDTWCLVLPPVVVQDITMLGMEHACYFPVHMGVPPLQDH